MKTSKTKCIVVTLLTMLLAFSLSACGQSDKEKALAEIKAVDVTTYFEDEQDSIKELKKDYTKKIEAIKDTDNDDKDDKAVAKELKAFKKALKAFSTKEAKIKSFKDELGKAIDKMDESKAKEAKKILDSYDEKLSKAKTNEAFQKLVTEIGDKIAKKTDVSVATVVESAQEASAPVTYSGGSVSSSSSSSSSGSSGSSSSGSSSSSSSGSSSGGSSSGGHTHSWATRTQTGSRVVPCTVYKCEADGTEWETGAAAASHANDLKAQGLSASYGPVSSEKTITWTYDETYCTGCGLVQ